MQGCLAFWTSLLLLPQVACAEAIIPHNPITTFGPAELGGIRTIVRYAVTRPDRNELAYLLLGALDNVSGAQSQIQVDGLHGDEVTLRNVDGADCTLAQSAIVRSMEEVVLIEAVRADSAKEVLAGSYSMPGMMDVHVYRRKRGGNVGQSWPLFREMDPPRRTGQVCSAPQVTQAITTIMRQVAGARP
jgi:hypothetical protein